jgi:ABC-2 type transport system permease protein
MKIKKTAIISRSIIWIRRCYILTLKELVQLRRDWILILFMVYAFLAPVYLAGSGIKLSLNNASFIVHDDDQSYSSRELISRFQSPYFELKGQVSEPGKQIEMLDKGQVLVALDIPPGFEENIFQGRGANVQMLIDTTNSVVGFLASNYGQQIVNEFGRDQSPFFQQMQSNSLEAYPVIQEEHRVLFNPNQNESWFEGITELLIMVSLFSVLLPAAAMAREKEKGTIEQLAVTPLTPFQVILPKLISMTLVILFGSTLSLFIVLRWAFDVPILGSLWLFYFLLTLYVFTMCGLGLLMATIARNMAQVGMLTILVFVPIMFLSGVWTPPETMPAWARVIPYCSPLYYFINITFGIFLKGAGIELLWKPALKMALIGGVFLGIGIIRLGKQFR